MSSAVKWTVLVRITVVEWGGVTSIDLVIYTHKVNIHPPLLKGFEGGDQECIFEPQN